MPAFLSIVIPTYNSFSFMEKLLSSLEKHTCRDFEVVVADDCSKDESYLRLFEYSARTEIVMRVYQMEENGGPGAARNFGLSKAIGEYITFVDSDDWVSENFVESIKNALSGRNYDGLLYDYYRYENNKLKYIHSFGKMNVSGDADINEAALYASTVTFGKVFKTELIKEHEICFPDIMRLEDFCFGKIAVLSCKNLYYLKEPLYFYVIRPGSIMGNDAYFSVQNSMKAFKGIEERFGETHHEIAEALFAVLCLYVAPVGMAIEKAKTKEIREYIMETEKMYPDCYSNKYLSGYPRHTRNVIKACKKHKISTVKFYAFMKKILKKR